MIYAVIGLAILGMVIALLYGLHRPAKKTKDHHEPRAFQFFINFILALLAVFVGAFLGFQLSDYQTRMNEKNDVKSMISRSVLELEDEIGFMNKVYEYYNQKDPEEAERRMNANDIQPLFSLNVLLNNQYFSKYVTPLSTMILQQFVRQEEKVRSFINDPSYNLKDRINGINTYIKLLRDIKLVLSLEADYLDNKISYKTMLEELDSADLINTNPVPFISEDTEGTLVPNPVQP